MDEAQEEEEEDLNDPFDDDNDIDPTNADAILDDILRCATHPQSHGNRYAEQTRQWAFELLQTCGRKALMIARRVIPLPSRQSLCRNPPVGYERSDLTELSLVLDRVRKWRASLGEAVRSTDCPRCILACDALVCKPNVEVTADALSGLDARDFDLDGDLLESLTSSAKTFQEFIQGHWDHVLTAAFVFQVQPLNPKLRPFLIFAQAARDGKARAEQVELLKQLKLICSHGRITVGGFATDGDSAYDDFHEEQVRLNLVHFRKKPCDIPLKQRYRAISDILHILKRARYRMLKKTMMVIGLVTSSAELNLRRLTDLLSDDLSPIVFSDEPITKMHDSLPMVLFRFEVLLRLYEARELGWVAYFFPWVLLNEAMSHKDVPTGVRVKWFNCAYCYLMKCMITYQDRPIGPGMTAFGKKGDSPAVRRVLFDRKLLMHTTNSIVAIVNEISSAKTEISLRRISTSPLENKFGVTRIHAGVHQTLSEILKTMEIDEAVKFVYAQQAVKNRRLAYGEIVIPFEYTPGLWFSSLLFAESLLSVVGFPLHLSQLVLDQGEDALHVNVERLMSDELLPFAKTKFSLMSPRKRRSLYQELHGVSPSSRRLIISAKSVMGSAIRQAPTHPFEEHIAGLLGGRKRILSHQLRILIGQVCEMLRLPFDAPRQLNRSTKREMLEWIEANWEIVGEGFGVVAVSQRTLPTPRIAPFRVKDD
jgi:hypothetical protein